MTEVQENGSSATDARVAYRGLHNWVVLFRTRNLTVVNFGLLVGLAGVVLAWVSTARLAAVGFSAASYAPFLFLVIPLLLVAGSRLLEVLVNWRAVMANPGQKLLETGFTFQGGLILSALGVLGFALLSGRNVLVLFDAFVLAIPLGHAMGRVGCLTYGCCHGRPTKSRLSLTYDTPLAKASWSSGLQGVPLHPTQAYSAAGNLVIFVLLNGVAAAGPLHAGILSGLYLVVDSLARFAMEFLRWPKPTEAQLLKPYQWVSLSFVAAGILMLALASSMPMVDFSRLGEFGGELVAALDLAPWYMASFLVLFVCFGIHGPRVGRLR